jgi:DNA-binding transcriptional regulator GbsR (MarR family)
VARLLSPGRGTADALAWPDVHQEELMSMATHRWADEVKETVEAVKAMRDELRVQAHLAGMEAKASYEEVERRFENEQLAVRKSLKELLEAFRGVKDQFSKSAPPKKEEAVSAVSKAP